MAAPPTNVTPSELWRRLSARPRPSRIVPFPAIDANGSMPDVRIMVLRVEEIDDARLAAETWLRKRTRTPDGQSLVLSQASGEVLADRVALEVLSRAVWSVEPIPGSEVTGAPVYARHFTDADDVRKKLGADELLVLFNQYQLTQLESGPLETTMSEDDVDRWVEVLKEGASTVPLAPLSWVALAQLCRSLAARVPSTGSDSQEYPSETSPSSSESLDETSASGTSSSGEPPAQLSPRRIDDLMSQSEAAAFATSMYRPQS